MTRHGSYWNNIIIARVATSFFRVNLRQGRHRIRLCTHDCLYDIWYEISHEKKSFVCYASTGTGKVETIDSELTRRPTIKCILYKL